MKKIFITSAIVLSIISSSFAGNNNAYNFAGSRSFKNAFPDASNISVKTVDQLTKITFTSNSQNMEAYYSAEGEIMAKSRHIKLDELPAGSMALINNQYAGFDITEAIEFVNETDGSTHYYVALQSGNRKVILEAKGSSVSVYKQ